MLLKARYSLNESQQKKNLVTAANASVEFSRIAHSLMSIVDEIKKDELLPPGELSQDYDEDWGVGEYFVEYMVAQKEYKICLEKIKLSQNKFKNDLDKAKDKLDKYKDRQGDKKQLGNIGLQNITMEIARDIHTYIDAFSDEIQKFDTLTNRTTYAAFKVIEFMVNYDKKMDIKMLKKTIKQTKELSQNMRSLEKSFKQNKSVYDRKFAFGKELNAASRRASSQHNMFIAKTKRCILILDIHHENVSILFSEYLINNSFIYKLRAFFGFKRRVQFGKSRVPADYE